MIFLRLSQQNVLQLAVLCVCFLMAACSSKDAGNGINTVGEDGKPLQELHTSIGASPQTLDPQLVSGVPAMRVLHAISDTLVVLDLDTLQPKPSLAKSWVVSDDGLRYTFTLRDGLKWSDGSRMTANDFVYTWRRLLLPSVGHQYAVDLYAIKNAEAYNTGKIDDFERVGVNALDDKTLEFVLSRPDPLFMNQLSMRTLAPLPQANIENFGAMDDLSNPWSRAGNYVSSGPFVLKKWELNQVIEVIKNPHYWDADRVRLEKIFMYTAESEAVEERMFRSGKLHLTQGGQLPVEKIQTYREKNPDLLNVVGSFGTYYYVFNTTVEPFHDKRIRKALSMSIDRQLLVDKVTKGGQKPAFAMSDGYSDYKPNVLAEYNPEQARALLAEAGYPNGENFPKFSLLYNTSDGHKKIAVTVQQMWKKQLNVNVQLENQEWKVFLDTMRNKEFMLARSGSISTIGDPADLVGSYVTDHGMNRTGWSHAEFDALVKQAAVTLERPKRLSLLQQAEDILIDELPVMPFYFYTLSYLKAPELKGVKFNPIHRPNYKDMYIDAAAQ